MVLWVGRKPLTNGSGQRLSSTHYYRGGQAKPPISPFKNKSPVKRRPKIILKITDVLVIVALLLGLVYSLMVKAQPQVVANSFYYHPAKAYQQAAATKLKSFKDNNKIT